MALRINRYGIALLATFGLGGLALFFAPLSGEGEVWAKLNGVVWVPIALIGVHLIWRESVKAKHQQWVFQNGLRGSATVVSVSPGRASRRSGLARNRLAELNLTLDLDVPGVEPRRVEQSELLTAFAAAHLKPGLALPVVVNPADSEDLVLVW
jgi:hypothetical protein